MHLGAVPEMSLDEYRRKASFKIEALRVIIDEEDSVELKVVYLGAVG